MPTSTRSTRRSSSATTCGCAGGRSSSAAGSCSRPATRRRPTACARRWAAGWPVGCARGPWSCRRGSRRTRRRAGPSSRCSATPARWSRASRSTRRSSTSAGLRKIAGPAPEIAARLRSEVAARVGLPITVGVARTKFLAKVASRVAKPDGLLVVPVDGEQAFLHPLPVGMLWGVGKVTAEKLHGLGVRTVAEVAELGEPALVSLLGPAAGHHLFALSTGRDPRPVQVGRRRRSMGAQRALGNRLRAPGRSTRCWPGSSTGSCAGCGGRTGSAARSCCGCGSATSRGPPARTPCRGPRRGRTPCWRRRRHCSSRRRR